MAYHGIARPAERLERREPPPHDRWHKNLFTGTLVLRLETPPGQFVSPGTGRLTLATSGGREVVAQQAARAAGTPVLPGSGIKGAVRTVFELLSSSCDPFAWNDPQKRAQGGPRCTPYSSCPACSVFGLLSWNGRVSFSDAVPAPPDAVRTGVENVPIPWTPSANRTEGDFRVYDLDEAKSYDPDRRIWVKKPKELAREVFTGSFETRMIFWNLTPEELGRLLLSIGIGANEESRFHLRLGGVKYDGKGAVRVTPAKLTLTRPHRESFEDDASQRECSGWIEQARTSPWAQTFWPTLQELARSLEKTPKG